MTEEIDLKKHVHSTRVGNTTYTLYPMEIETRKVGMISAFVGILTGSAGGEYRSGAYTKITYGLAVTHNGMPLAAGDWQVSDQRFLDWLIQQTGQPVQKIKVFKLADQGLTGETSER